MAYYYSANVKWKEGRLGELSADGMDNFEVATPPDFPKGVPNVWTPEHLFVASANICLMTTFLSIAEKSKLEIKSYESGSTGSLDKVDGTVMFYEIELKPKIVVTQEKDIERAERLIEKAEQHCLVSNSMKTKIILSPEVSL